jgi:HEAT repeat protein
MERLHVAANLRKIDPALAKINAVNCAEDGYKVGMVQLAERLKEDLDTWSKLEKIIGRLSHFSSKVRAGAVQQLMQINDIRTLPALIEGMNFEDVNGVIEKYYVPALGVFRQDIRARINLVRFFLGPVNPFPNFEFGLYSVVRALGLSKLEDDNDPSLEMFLEAVAEFPSQKQVEIAANLAASKGLNVERIGIGMLLGFLSIEDSERQPAAVYALGNHGSPEVLPDLRALLPTDNLNLQKALDFAIPKLENPPASKRKPPTK